MGSPSIWTLCSSTATFTLYGRSSRQRSFVTSNTPLLAPGMYKRIPTVGLASEALAPLSLLARLGSRSLGGAAPYPAIQLLQDRLAVLGALLVIANLPELFGGKCIQACGDLFHVQIIVALYGELGIPYALLGVGDGDVEQLSVAAHDLLGHLLEGLPLLLGLLLEGLLLGLGLLHPLLGRLLDGLLLLLGLPGEVGTGGVKEPHVGVHQLLGHLLGVLLLLFDLLGQGLHRAEPLRLGTLRRVIHPTARRVPIHHA